jgi:hypothetical protein
VPVWFTFDDPVVTVFSRPDTAKIGHLRAHDEGSVFSQPIVVTLDRLVVWRSTAGGLEYRSLPSRV